VLDDRGHRVPVGTRGEICIGGAGLARGYWRRPELTRARFVDDPYRPGKRMYRTGDIGAYRSDGNLEFFGRSDNQIKLHGFRIELDEISNQLARHPDVEEAVVGVRAERLVAIVRLASEDVPRERLVEYMRAQLPPYMVPDEWVTVDAFPLTPSGKVDRDALFGQVAS
jgi:acyl-coenzyme A synthetase/AMP-(fatty) acid ligase